MPTAFKNADILIPRNVDMTKWAVVACDQYTSEPEYWNEVLKKTKGEKSSLNLILPEVYLENEDVDLRIEAIHKTMESYIAGGLFEVWHNAMIYVERVQSDGEVRCGLVGAIDLEQYDYKKGSKSPVRATEATVVERIPPRIKVRRGAELELPHIMILIDDEGKTVIEPLSSQKTSMNKVYDFELMQGGGAISGYLLNDEQQKRVENALSSLGDLDKFNAKYGLAEDSVLLYAMGDGNHSLATAKEFYEEQKRENPQIDFSNHPSRYALVELVNLHSSALRFEAIHRIVTEIDSDKLMSFLTEELALSEEPSEQWVTVVKKGVREKMYIHNPLSKLSVGSLQSCLDRFLAQNGGKIDYIHGEEVVGALSMSPKSLGFLLPDMAKSELFPTVICDGALPRKTFSMGHASDKRFYVEARKITKNR